MPDDDLGYLGWSLPDDPPPLWPDKPSLLVRVLARITHTYYRLRGKA